MEKVFYCSLSQFASDSFIHSHTENNLKVLSNFTFIRQNNETLNNNYACCKVAVLVPRRLLLGDFRCRLAELLLGTMLLSC
jgi:hypothetical protein